MPTRPPGNQPVDYGEMADLLLAPARLMTMQGPKMPGMWGKIHDAIDPVQAFGGYGNMSTAIMGGPMAKTANLNQLAFAKAAEKAKIPSATIWEATGWHKNPKDGQWRFEIPDNKAHLWSETAAAVGAGARGVNMKGPGRFSHPDLYAAYPELANVKLHGIPSDRGYRGQQRGRDIDLAPQFRPKMQSTLLHEIQHIIQDIENTGRGSNVQMFSGVSNAPKINRLNKSLELIERRTSALAKNGGYNKNAPEIRKLAAAQEKLLQLRSKFVDESNPYNLYKTTSGEVEARNVQHREAWDAQRRKDVPPEFSQDVPYSKQHVVMPSRRP
jgi:hypothetical protein